MHFRNNNSESIRNLILTWQKNGDKTLELELSWRDSEGVLYRAWVPLNSIKTIEVHETERGEKH